MSLAVGHITYANCTPFFGHLREVGFRGQIVPGVPAALNRLLADGKIDVSPSSSFEYARNWREYLLLPDVSISSFGAVKSVLLFSPRPPEELAGTEIALTGESATSVHLLQILLCEFYGFQKIRAGVPKIPVEELISAGKPALLIGDRALRAALSPPPGMQVYDLGELWRRHTGCPFVFALWIIRRQSAERWAGEIHEFLAQLAESRRRAFADLHQLAADAPERKWLGEQALVDYWRAMSYDLTETHLSGLRLFFRLCTKHGFLLETPELHFFS